MIEITAITHPARGGIVAYHCSKCRRTVFDAHPFVVPPFDGEGYYKVELCADFPLHGVEWKYNTRLMPKYEAVQVLDPETVLPGIY